MMAMFYEKNAWPPLKILTEDLRLSSNVAVTVTKKRKLLSKIRPSSVCKLFQKSAIRVSNHKSESGSYIHHFHEDWWQLAFYRILKYVF
jgi:hypothetical protein